MAWIRVMNEPEATGDLAEYYRKSRERGRSVLNVQKAMSLNPRAMEAIDDLQRSWREYGVISSRHRDMVAVVNVCTQPVLLLNQRPRGGSPYQSGDR